MAGRLLWRAFLSGRRHPLLGLTASLPDGINIAVRSLHGCWIDFGLLKN